MNKKLLKNTLKVFSLLLGISFSLFKPGIANAQCPYTNNQYPGYDIGAPGTVGQTVQISTCSFGGEFSSVTGFLSNNLYTVSVGGFSPGYITIFNASNVAVAFGNSPLSFVPPVSGNYKTQWSVSSGCEADGSCHVTSVTYTAAPAAAPPAPVQDPTPPNCATGTSLSMVGSPSAGDQWYWQTSATGTSTATPYSGPYTVMNNGTYYIRTLTTASGLWSAATSFTVTNFPTATSPPSPTADVNPSCLPGGTTLTEAAAPAGYIYYWQTISNGVNTTNNASSSYNVTTSGTYYVSAYETATQCWSNTVGIAVAVDSYIPPAPVAIANPLNVCINAPSAMVGATPGASNGTALVTFGTNYTMNPGAATLTGNISIPNGATVTSSVLTFNGITTGPSQYLSDMSFTLTGASTYGNTSFPGAGATNAGPFNYNTTTNPAGGVVNLNMNNSWFQAATFATITLSVNYTLPVPSISWYNAAIGGTQLGTGSPFEAVGTTVLPNTSTQGAYTIYAAAAVGGCKSTTIPITINVTPVLAPLTPIDVTCNGFNNGSFTIGTSTCGSGTYLVSLTGGAPFGAIPTNLVAGTYSVILQDQSNMMQSAPITLVITEPTAPTALSVDVINYYTADVSWTPSGDETSWNIEYGPVGFILGTGMTMSSSTPSATLINLDPDTEYEFYVAAGCVVGSDFGGPEAFTTNAGFFTYDGQCGPGFIDISTTGTALNLTDDATTVITTGFPIAFQTVNSDQMTVSNNGWVSFNGANFAGFDVFSTDLDDEEGNVYYETVTIAGENYFIVQWDNRPHYTTVSGQNVTFEVIFSETTGEIWYIYDDAIFGGSQSNYDNGLGSYIAAAGDVEEIIVSDYDDTYLSNNTCIHFYNALCPNVQNLTSDIYPDEVILNWDAGLYGETDWNVVYGLDGFDPTIPAEVIGDFDYNTSAADIFNLEQNTTYEFIIYSDCAADNLMSDGYHYIFTTPPFCANPTLFAGTSNVDTLDLTWDWNEFSSDYPVTEFNFQYGMNGATPWEETATGLDFADTIANPALLAGGVYEVYIQATCSNPSLGTDTSAWVGPITIVMPLSNDTVCGAETLALATPYTFNNVGATVSVDEVNIAPPATGAQTTTGWANSTLNNTTWFKFVAPASGSVRINNTATNYNGQLAVYDVADCGDFNSSFLLVNANDNEIGGTSVAPNFTVCGLTPGSTYYILHDGSGTTGNYSVMITEIVLEAGLAQPLTQICTGEVMDLFTTISGNDASGVWSAPIAAANASITGSTFNSAGLGYQVFNFQYRMSDGCAYDSIVSQVQIFGLSSAGEDGVLTVCKNEPFNLIAGLNGNFDTGGQWYDISNNPTTSDQISSQFPGSFNFDYITGNGVCPDDSSNVVINVLNSCDWLSLEEAVFAGVQLYPNPTSGIINIDADNVFAIEITDANGRMINSDYNTTIGTTTVDLSKVQVGVYFVTLRNEDASKVFRVVVQ